MKKHYTPMMKLLACMLLSFCHSFSFAQTTHTIGNGTTSNAYTAFPTPFGDWNEATRMQFLYVAPDLVAAGMKAGRITAIKFDVVNLNTSSGIHENYTIAIKNTSTTTLSTTAWETGTTQVWGPINYQPVLGINTFTLSTPFIWDGTSSILVEICHGDIAAVAGTTWTRNSSVNYTTVTYNANHTYAADAQPTGCGIATTTQNGTATLRPNIIFDIISCLDITGLTATNLQKYSATINWNSNGSSILGYEYVLDQYPSDPTTAGTLITANTYPASGLAPGTTYYFHVRTKCSSTSYSQWKTISFTTPICKPVDDLKISGITDHSAQFDWSSLPVTTSYEYIVTPSGTLPAGGYINTTSTTASENNLSPYTLYNVFIRSKCAGNDSSLWRQYSFTTSSQCMPPVLSATEVSDGQWKIEWEDLPGSVAYEYALSGLNTPTIGNTIYTNSVTFALPDDGAPYYVYARTKCDNIFTTSPWASVMLRDGLGLSVANAKTSDIQIYPNPIKDKFTININGKMDKTGTLVISDLSGKVVLSTTIDKTLSEIDMSQRPAGTYIIKYTDSYHSQLFKINKL